MNLLIAWVFKEAIFLHCNKCNDCMKKYRVKLINIDNVEMKICKSCGFTVTQWCRSKSIARGLH